jgi:hypothetical protein
MRLPSPSDRVVRFGVPLAYVVLAAALTWPMVATFTTKIGGDFGDGFQNLWNFWWLKEAVTHLRNPFFTDHLRAPFGVTLVFQTFCLPDAIISLPLWLVLPPLGVYNSVVLWSFVLTGWGMYALIKDWTGSWLAAFFAGAAFMATPFHMAHALGHQHLVALGYLPLYLMFLHRIVRGGTWRDAALGGLSLAGAAFCSWYQLIFAFGWSLGVFVYAAIAHRKAFVSLDFLKRALTLAAVFLLLTGPLMLAMYLAARGEPIVGAHDARWYSADLQSFFYPNARSAWSHVSMHWRYWTGNSAENGDYLGYVLLALGAFGIWKSGLGRAYAVTGLIGALLSLGPSLHQGGRVSPEQDLPYAMLVKLVPGLDFSGVPVRFGLMAQGALVILAGLGLAALLERIPRPQQFALPLTALAAALVLVEFWPEALPTSVWPVPAPMADWAKSDEDFTVLDLTGDTRMLWNAIHHRHRCVGGYVTRAPKRLDDWWDQHPVFSQVNKKPQRMVERLRRDDPAIDFDWGQGSPDPSIFSDLFHVRWDGSFEVPQSGEYTFYLSADDGASVRIDGQVVLQGRVGRFRSGPVTLAQGVHQLHVEYEELYGSASVHLEWEGPGMPQQVLKPVSDTAGAAPVFHGVYSDMRVELRVSREEALAKLREAKLRFIVINALADARDPLWEGTLGLPLAWTGDGMRIYEVPAEGSGTASR